MIPCKDCLLIPACRCKSYRRLLNECSLLSEALYNNATKRVYVPSRRKKGFIEKVSEVHRRLHPLQWKPRVKNVYEEGDGGIEIVQKVKIV